MKNFLIFKRNPQKWEIILAFFYEKVYAEHIQNITERIQNDFTFDA